MLTFEEFITEWDSNPSSAAASEANRKRVAAQKERESKDHAFHAQQAANKERERHAINRETDAYNKKTIKHIERAFGSQED